MVTKGQRNKNTYLNINHMQYKMDLLKIIDDKFVFLNIQIRVIGSFSEPWFVAKDICDILDIKNTTMALEKLPENWKVFKKIETLGGEQEMRVINEAGLYKLVMRSNKPIAETFQHYVCETILPTIRKTGEFRLQQMLEQKTKELEQKSEELEKISNNHNKILKRRKREPYDIGNVCYIISHPAFDTHYQKTFRKIGKATQKQKEDVSAFQRRLTSYNTSAPHNYIVHYVIYIEQNDFLENAIKMRFAEHVEELNKEEWIKDISVETIVQYIRSVCNFHNFSYTEHIPNQTLNVDCQQVEQTTKETKRMHRSCKHGKRQAYCLTCYKDPEERKNVRGICEHLRRRYRCPQCKKIGKEV